MPGQTEKALDFLDGKRGLSPFIRPFIRTYTYVFLKDGSGTVRLVTGIPEKNERISRK